MISIPSVPDHVIRRPTPPIDGGLAVWVLAALLCAWPSASASEAPRQTDDPAPAPPSTAESAESAEDAETAPDAVPEPVPTGPDLSEANALIREAKYSEANDLLAGLEQEYPDDPALLLMRGEILLALQRAPDALAPLKKCAELDPERPRVNFQLATALSITGDADGALAAFAAELATNDEPDVQALALLNRSMLFQQRRAWADAAAELERLLELQPQRTQAYGDLATLYIQSGKPDMAADALARGEEAGFHSAEHYYSLGASQYRDSDYEAAVEALENALAIEPDLAKAERSLGAALERLDRPDEAVVHLRRYLELSPDAPDAERVAEQIRNAEGG
jgi:predicted Zn-dependent protease